jgi:branched-chain amino acid transport system ATP-binding protein
MSRGNANTKSAPGRGLEITGVVVLRGGRPVVKGVSITVVPGEVTTLLGPNGAGKSSLALAVSGLLRASSGSVAVDGIEIGNARPEKVRANGVSVVPEGRRLLSDLTVADNMRAATYSLSKNAAAEGTDYVLNLFPELEKRWEIGARLLSGGEQQMVVLGQALVSQPKVLVIDELSLGLAPIIVKRLVPTLQKVAESGVGVLLIEQFAHVALSVANRAYVLEGGEVRYDGTAEELRAKPELLHSAYLLQN